SPRTTSSESMRVRPARYPAKITANSGTTASRMLAKHGLRMGRRLLAGAAPGRQRRVAGAGRAAEPARQPTGCSSSGNDRKAAAMLWRTSRLTDYRIEATDGSIGRVADLLFEDDSWVVRWLAVDTGGWLTGRQVLLPASGLGPPDGDAGRIPVALTRDM